MGTSEEGMVPLARSAVVPFVVGFLAMVGVGIALSLVGGSRGGADAMLAAATSVQAGASTPGADEVVQPVTATAGSSAPQQRGPMVEDWSSTYVTVDGLNIDIYDEPDGTVVRELRSADVLTVPGATPLVMLVAEAPTEEQAAAGSDVAAEAVEGWYEVYLPIRPNGTTGWVRAEDVRVDTTDFWIEVSLSDFELVVHEGRDVVLRTEIGVGRDDRPTPGGVYYVKELLKVPNASGAYGPYAYGLSGYQSTLESFNGGQAVIGIHGTNDPTSFGRVVSSGCVRVPNATITRLAEVIGPPLGTPVRITE